MIGRRNFITLLGGAAVWPLAAGAQTAAEADHRLAPDRARSTGATGY